MKSTMKALVAMCVPFVFVVIDYVVTQAERGHAAHEVADNIRQLQ